jgi:hypothetical protein
MIFGVLNVELLRHYRGSSFLLWKDYRIHKDVVNELFKNKYFQQFNFSSIKNDEPVKSQILAFFQL